MPPPTHTYQYIMYVYIYGVRLINIFGNDFSLSIEVLKSALRIYWRNELSTIV